MIQYYQWFFGGLLILLIYLLMTNSSHLLFRHRYLWDNSHETGEEENGWKISYYGLICGLSIILASPFIISCQLSMIKVVYLLILYIISIYLLCSHCREGGYHMVTTYYLLLPFAAMALSCGELQTFTLALTVALSFGRLACAFAGCCYGEKIPDEQVKQGNLPLFHMKYPDPKQLINRDYEVEECYAKPTVLIEAILQIGLTLACLMFPDRANFIYGLGSIFILGFSEYRSTTGKSQRKAVKEAMLGCLLFLSVCFIQDGGFGQCYRLASIFKWQDFVPYVILAGLTCYGTSNDVNIQMSIPYFILTALSYFWIQKMS